MGTNFKYLLAILLLFLNSTSFAERQKLPVLLFYSKDCRNCDIVRQDVVPEIRKKYGEKLEITLLDVEEESSYSYLTGLEEKYGDAGNDFPVVFLQGRFINGRTNIEKEIFSEIENALKKNILPMPEQKVNRPLPKVLSIIAVISGGALDGINPCVFTVIIFFVSYLFYLKKDRRNIVYSGLFFILGSFITYYLLGIGIYRTFESLTDLKTVRKVFNLLVGCAVIIFSALSFWDVYSLYKGDGIRLKMSNSTVLRMHEIIKKLTFAEGAVFLSMAIGGLVTLIEFPCSGQIYVPIVLLIQKNLLRGYLYLLLYNIFFVLPLVFLFALILLGGSLNRFSSFYARHIIVVKLCMGLLFLCMGLFLLI
jgi:cytochrome c biogenesis protein CcdA